MGKEKNDTSVCKSFFKNGDEAISKKQFTKVWIEMINKIEKGKNINFSEK